MKKKFIVITTISKKTKCLSAIDKKSLSNNYELIVIGDKKSPNNMYLKNGKYFNIKNQKKLDFSLKNYLPLNHYSRKNLGYLIAVQNGAQEILETDDDNYPLKNFFHNDSSYISSKMTKNKPFVNIYKYFTKEKIWPRGFPLRYIKNEVVDISDLKTKKIQSCIKQYLANGEPDVDAIYRLVFDNLNFEKKINNSISLSRFSWCPFNSQNTIWFQKAFPLLYLPSTCSFRVCDILRSYIAQRISWESGFFVSFHRPSVTQIRNKHDLIEDFKQETNIYIKIEDLTLGLQKLKLKKGIENISENLIKCYKFLVSENHLKNQEMTLLEKWILDLNNAQNNIK